ncbi:hypothetical protein H6F42_12315 [Pseudanabaena sp. FACHB-1998]|nr:hypothetical protein [Pseudanabaena sp. FACHB-1998]
MSQYVLPRIQSLQERLENLKKLVNHQLLPNSRKTTYIKGLWKDLEISEIILQMLKEPFLRMLIIGMIRN